MKQQFRYHTSAISKAMEGWATCDKAAHVSCFHSFPLRVSGPLCVYTHSSVAKQKDTPTTDTVPQASVNFWETMVLSHAHIKTVPHLLNIHALATTSLVETDLSFTHKHKWPICRNAVMGTLVVCILTKSTTQREKVKNKEIDYHLTGAYEPRITMRVPQWPQTFDFPMQGSRGKPLSLQPRVNALVAKSLSWNMPKLIWLMSRAALYTIHNS